MSQSSDVDKLVSDFLAELNALDQSLRQAQGSDPQATAESTAPAAEKNRAPAEAAPPPPAQGHPPPAVNAPPPQTQVPAAKAPLPAVEPPAQVEPPARAAAAVPEAAEPAVPVTSEPVPRKPVRNIDVLLMDDAQLPPAKKSAPVVDDTDVFQSCRALYEAGHAGAFGHGRKSRFRIWAGGVVVLGCFAAAVHLWPPRAAKPPAEPSAARKVIPPLTPAPEAISMTTAAPVGKIEPKRPPWVKNSRGVVEVVAEVDEKGNVLRANAVSGPSALHSTAVRAVTRARFHPARRNGIPVKSTVTIAIKF